MQKLRSTLVRPFNHQCHQSGVSLVGAIIGVAILGVAATLTSTLLTRTNKASSRLTLDSVFMQNRELLLNGLDCDMTFAKYAGNIQNCDNDVELWSKTRSILPRGDSGKAVGPYHYRSRCGLVNGQWTLGVQWIRYKKDGTTPFVYKTGTSEGGQRWGLGTQAHPNTSRWTDLYPNMSICRAPDPAGGAGSVGGNCDAGKVANSISPTGGLNCIDFAKSCNVGEVVTGFNAQGQVQCTPVPTVNTNPLSGAGAQSCPPGKFVAGFNGNTIVCN